MDAEAEASRAAHNAIEIAARVRAIIRDTVATIVMDDWWAYSAELKSNYGMFLKMKNEKSKFISEGCGIWKKYLVGPNLHNGPDLNYHSVEYCGMYYYHVLVPSVNYPFHPLHFASCVMG